MTEPFDRFKDLNPFTGEPDSGELDDRDTELLHRIMAQPIERDEQLLTSIVAEQDAHLTGPEAGSMPDGGARSRRPLWLVTAAVATVALATAAFAVLRTERATVPNAVACHATADLLGDVAGLGGSADPIAACAEVWARGDFGGDGVVPPLTACVNSGGAAAVFPGGAETCDQLGLPALEPGFTDEQQAAVDLQDRLATVFLESCFDQEAAVAEAERQLELLGLTDWTVRVTEEFPVGEPCAAPGILAVERVVFFAGVRDN